MQWELVRDKLRRVVQRLPEEEQSPELHNLLRAMEAVAAARELLMEVEPPVQTTLQDGTCAISFDSRLLKGLALFLQSAALCLDAGAMVIPGDMGDRTFRLLLAPYIQHSPDGRVQVCTPETLSAPHELSCLQLLVAGVLLETLPGAVISKEHILALLSAGTDALWQHTPAALAATAHFVRPHPPNGNSGSGSGSGSGSSGSREGGGSAAASGGIANAPQEASMAALLQRHCPEITVTDLQRYALRLRAHHTTEFLIRQRAAAGELTARVRSLIAQLLADCQVLIGMGDAYGWACAAQLAQLMPLEKRQQVQQALEEGIRSCQDTKCFVAATTVMGHWAALLLVPAADRGLPASARREALSRARRLVDGTQAILPHIKAWAPRSTWLPLQNRLQWLDQRVREVETTGRVQSTTPDASVGGTTATANLPTCASCGSPAMVLRKCSACKQVAYCSRACQVQDWREGGHKEACAGLAAQRAAARQ